MTIFLIISVCSIPHVYLKFQTEERNENSSWNWHFCLQ